MSFQVGDWVKLVYVRDLAGQNQLDGWIGRVAEIFDLTAGRYWVEFPIPYFHGVNLKLGLYGSEFSKTDDRVSYRTCRFVYAIGPFTSYFSPCLPSDVPLVESFFRQHHHPDVHVMETLPNIPKGGELRLFIVHNQKVLDPEMPELLKFIRGALPDASVV